MWRGASRRRGWCWRFSSFFASREARLFWGRPQKSRPFFIAPKKPKKSQKLARRALTRGRLQRTQIVASRLFAIADEQSAAAEGRVVPGLAIDGVDLGDLVAASG